MRERGQQDRSRNVFIASWIVVTAIKCVLAARLPLFVDEAFYWQEGQHLAPAYSDLPGLSAWLARMGVAIGGQHALALRWPFLLIAAALPWLMARMAAREFGASHAWRTASLTLLLPLAGTLGVLALPDVPMALATVLCLDAGARLLRGVDARAASELALGLAIGAFSHYRFAAVIAVGALALSCLPEGRRALRDARVWVAIVVGALAWLPLMWWNAQNAEAGLRFQLIDRHPWAFHWDGLRFLLIQALLVTPLLLAAMAAAVRRGRHDSALASRYLSLCGMALVVGFFALGFFADVDRVSFHWPLPGYLAILPLVPLVLATWPRAWRLATWLLLAVGLSAGLVYYAAVSTPSLRERAAAEKWYPANFSGWNEVADAVRGRLSAMPPETRLLVDNFKLGAELGFALGDADIAVLDHPLNHQHGRAPQLRLWGLEMSTPYERGEVPTLLVVGVSEVQYKRLLQHYHDLCAKVGPLPPPIAIDIDHGAQRFLMFDLSQRPSGPACTTPAMAWIDTPASGARTAPDFEMAGWAFKDGIGLSRVEVTIDGTVVAEADYGTASPGTARFWRISNDPDHPDVGYRAMIDASRFADGRHWLGLRLHGKDGSIETWREQPVEIAR